MGGEASGPGGPAPDEQSGSAHGKRRLAALLATAAAVVGLATGVLTLGDQIFGEDESEGDSNVVVAPLAEPVPEFTGIAGHFTESQAFTEFLIAHDKETVLLDVTLEGDAREESPDPADFPATFLKTDCEPGASPGSEFCNGWLINVFGDPNEDTQFGVSHGVPVLDGYFAVDVSSDAFQGERPITLEPRTRDETSQE